jgi:uncharacterized protein (UPF0332 family)
MSPEQQQLMEKAQRILEAAQQLIQHGFYDFAVSRSYYAMFYVAEALLDRVGLAFSSHATVISAFEQQFFLTCLLCTPLHSQFLTKFCKPSR